MKKPKKISLKDLTKEQKDVIKFRMWVLLSMLGRALPDIKIDVEMMTNESVKIKWGKDESLFLVPSKKRDIFKDYDNVDHVIEQIPSSVIEIIKEIKWRSSANNDE